MPKSKAERMAYLEEDAKRILAAPNKHGAAEVQWARDMLAARNPGGTGAADTSAEADRIARAKEIMETA